MYAYGALVSKPESRATRLALFDGTESLFVVIGTILSPIIKNNFGRYTNYGLKVGCTFLALLYTIFLVKEPPKSDEGKDKKQEKLTIITPLLSFVDLIKTVFKRLQKISYQMFLTQIREQMSGPDLHVFTLKFLALKKWSFQFFFDFCLPLFYAFFLCGP